MAPPVLYKYTSNLGFLENGLFRFSQPGALNDPKEAQPRIVFKEYAPEDYDAARAMAERNISQDELEALYMHPFPAWRFDEKGFPGLWPAKEIRLSNEPFYSIEDFDKAVMDKAVSLCRKISNQNFGIFCMTESTDDHLWAYYAADHTGIAITIDAKHPFFSSAVVQVEYSEASIPVSSNHGVVRIAGQRINQDDILTERMMDIPLELLLQKRPSWSHEKEWRMVKRLDEGKNTGKLDNNNIPVFLFSIPPECIIAITFGYKASNFMISETQKMVEKSDIWQHLELRQRKQLSNGSIHEEKLNRQ